MPTLSLLQFSSYSVGGLKEKTDNPEFWVFVPSDGFRINKVRRSDMSSVSYPDDFIYYDLRRYNNDEHPGNGQDVSTLTAIAIAIDRAINVTTCVINRSQEFPSYHSVGRFREILS